MSNHLSDSAGSLPDIVTGAFKHPGAIWVFSPTCGMRFAGVDDMLDVVECFLVLADVVGHCTSNLADRPLQRAGRPLIVLKPDDTETPTDS